MEKFFSITGPYLMRNGTAHVSLAVGKGDCSIGMLRFTAKIDSEPNSATWLYEIIKEK